MGRVFGNGLVPRSCPAAWAYDCLAKARAEGAESAEGVTGTQGVIALAGGAHLPGGDDPHWGPRPTTNGKEVGRRDVERSLKAIKKAESSGA